MNSSEAIKKSRLVTFSLSTDPNGRRWKEIANLLVQPGEEAAHKIVGECSDTWSPFEGDFLGDGSHEFAGVTGAFSRDSRCEIDLIN
jgi:hypothetical protein